MVLTKSSNLVPDVPVHAELYPMKIRVFAPESVVNFIFVRSAIVYIIPEKHPVVLCVVAKSKQVRRYQVCLDQPRLVFLVNNPNDD